MQEEQRKKRNPYDISTWGPECGRGLRPKDRGTVTQGKAAIRTFGGGRKAYRGMAADGLDRQQEREHKPPL